MAATLYTPGQDPVTVPVKGLYSLDDNARLALDVDEAASLLGCTPQAVDVLASGPGYIAYSIFNYEEGPVNLAAMEAVGRILGLVFDSDNEDATLYGPVLIALIDA